MLFSEMEASVCGPAPESLSMFDYVRKHTKIMMGVLFLLIIPSFVLFGIDGYNRFSEKGQTVARVAGTEIAQEEWDGAHQMEADRLRTSMPGLDPRLLDSPEARYATLERLVRQRVMAQAAQAMRLQTGDVRLARELQSDPMIAALRRPDGSLDMERYSQLVGSQGMTPEMYEARMRSNLSVRQVESGVTDTALPVRAVADMALDAYHDQREVQLANFLTQDFTARVEPTEAELQAFYQDNLALFQAPEQADIEYLVLDIDAVKQGIKLNEQDLRTYYEQNVDRLSGTEERRASHILISAVKDAPAAEREMAKARATELLAQARKNPAGFAELARKNSQDPGSASQGGDLDFFGRGAMVKPFEDAVFAMAKGEISEVVESDFGYHIIRLTDVKTPHRKSFEQLRASLEADLKAQQARIRYAEAAESFTNGVYEQADSLQPVADLLKLEVRQASGVTRKAAPGAQGALASQKLLTALFSADVVEQKHNTEAVEIAPSQLAAARITRYQPQRTLAFAEVREAVRERVRNTRAAELARKEGEARLAAWTSDPAQARLQAPQIVSRDKRQEVQLAVLLAALRADESKLPVLLGVDLGSQGYAVLRVIRKVPRQAPAADAAKQERSQYLQLWTAAESEAYYQTLKSRFEVEILVPRPVSPLAQ